MSRTSANAAQEADLIRYAAHDAQQKRIVELEAALLGLHQLAECVLDHTLQADSELGRSVEKDPIGKRLIYAHQNATALKKEIERLMEATPSA